MVASVAQYLPRSQDRDRLPKDGGQEIVAEVDDRLRHGLTLATPWISQAHTAYRYYKSDQYKSRASRKDRNRIRLVANFIRRDVDMIVSEILDGSLVVNPLGRNPRYYELGRQLLQILDWTRDEEETWDAQLERVITSCIHIGEGVLFEGWNQQADRGKGRPACVQIDSRMVLWDEYATDPQRDDAAWVLWISYELIANIEANYPQIAGRVGPETYEAYSPLYGGSQDASARPTHLIDPARRLKERAWIKRQWSKTSRYEKNYYYVDTGEPAMVYRQGDDGEVVEEPLTSTHFRDLTPEEQDAVTYKRDLVTELWEDVIVNDTLVEHHLSPFDTSRGGHGHYPFAFFQYETLPDEPRARGEISFLTATQDIHNEVITQLLEQLFLNNVGYWHIFKGSLPPEERSKFDRIFDDPHQVVESFQGVSPPTHQGISPGGMQAFSSVIPVIEDIADKTSGIQEVDRGQVPGNIQSGRAIRALQAKSSRLSLKVKRHVESGLRRATLLRLHNILQFMRGPRVLEVTDPKKQSEGKLLYLGWSEEELIDHYRLRPGKDEEGEEAWVDPYGHPAELMVLNDEVAEDIIFERVKLTLDTGQEANRLERMDQAEMVLNTVGAAAIPWAAKQLDWANADELVAAIERRDEIAQTMQMAEQFQQQTGMSLQDAMQVVLRSLQPAGGTPEAAPGRAAQGPPPPGAMPPGAASGVPRRPTEEEGVPV